MSIKCDILIIGAGPAGLSAALILSNEGFSTIILEKNKKSQPNNSKYDITEGTQIHKILDELDVKPKKISSISEWNSPNYRYILDSKIEDFYFKRGSEEDSLENLLIEKLNKNFISVNFNSKVNSIRKKEKNVIEVVVDKDNKKIKVKPKYIIVADGSDSNFRRKMNLKSDKFAIFNGLGVLIETEKKDIIPHARIFFNQNIAPGGYIYSGSVDKDTFFCITSDSLLNKKILSKQHLEFFIKREIKEKYIIKNYFSGIGISGIQKVNFGNVIFIGGAALLNDPFLGYGLNYAIESAFFAAKSIENNNLEIYTKYIDKIQHMFKDLFFAREIWREADNDFFDKLIQTFNGKYSTTDKKISKIQRLFF
jgi:flavin-dependent dehydrogenase